MDNVVVGHLCQDPILRQPRRGSRPVARFTVAVNSWRRVGEAFIERPPVFHRVVCFGPMAENVTNSLRKGMEVLAVGEWVDDSYSDEQGQRKVQVAMEAKVVGAALRWATAVVRKADRRANSEETSVDPPVAGPVADPVVPPDSDDQQVITTGDTPDDPMSVDVFAAAVVEPPGPHRGGMHRLREQEPETVSAGGG